MRKENVIYDDRIPKLQTPMKSPKSNKLLILLSLLFFISLLLIVYLQSPYSKLQDVTVEGNVLLEWDMVLSRAQLELGQSIFQLKTSHVQQRLVEQIEINSASVERVFPHGLHIELVEYPVVAYWVEGEQLYPVLSSGHILMHVPWTYQEINRPLLTGWSQKEGLIELSEQLLMLPLSVHNQISEIVLTPLVSDPYRLTLYMKDGYEVRTSIRKFAENLSWYPHFVEQAQGDGKLEGIFNLFDGKWYEDPTLIEEEE